MNFEYSLADPKPVQLAKQRERHYHLPLNEFRVLHYLHMRCNQKLEWGEKQRSIAMSIFRANGKQHRDEIQRIINSLEKKGFLEKKRYVENRKRYTSYILNPKNNWQLPEIKSYDPQFNVLLDEQKPNLEHAEKRRENTQSCKKEKQESVEKIRKVVQESVEKIGICNDNYINDNYRGKKTSTEEDSKSKHASLSSRKLARNKNKSKEELIYFYDEILDAYNETLKSVFNARKKRSGWEEQELRFFETIPDRYSDQDLIDAVRGYCEESDYALKVSTKKSNMKKINVILRHKNSKYPERIYTRIEDCAEHYREHVKLNEIKSEKSRNEKEGKEFIAGKGWLTKKEKIDYMEAVRLKEEEKFKKLKGD